MKRKTVLTVAGSDSSGGAGIQADIKTMTVNGVYAMSAITALTAQNTLGVTDIMEVTPEFLQKQLAAVFDDIRPDAVKIGMIASEALIKETAAMLKKYAAQNIVVDPVMVASSGARLMAADAVDVLMGELIPLADVVTPNIPEAEILSGMSISDEHDMEEAAVKISTFGAKAVLVKGGHGINDANDILFDGEKIIRFTAKRIETKNTHGTGCTLSSAIASNLAKEYSMEEAVSEAKKYLTSALAADLNLGHGTGPLDHAFMLR